MNLQKMSETAFLHYLDDAIDSYANELLNSCRFSTKKEAIAFASWEFKEDIFKDGCHTENTFIFNLIHEDEPVGIIWLLIENEVSFIGDFLVFPKYKVKDLGPKP
ncbi:hypothetical protein [Enterococcus larvae]|uniref:hypothetical protein n=1 Tax=Enterococcus larvae TaxID=2794352 RepID=UPI003F3FF102